MTKAKGKTLPERYPYIVAWGHVKRLAARVTLYALSDAADAGAPAGATHCLNGSGKWATVADAEPATRAALEYCVANAERLRDEGRVRAIDSPQVSNPYPALVAGQWYRAFILGAPFEFWAPRKLDRRTARRWARDFAGCEIYNVEDVDSVRAIRASQVGALI